MLPLIVTWFLIIIPDLCLAGGDCVNDLCDWEPWRSWDSCSRTCGGGYRKRSRSLCCRAVNGEAVSTCNEECGKESSGYSEYAACNTQCQRGSFKYNHYDIRNYLYSYGYCSCPQGYTGTCCGSDKNECSSSNRCQHSCINTYGSYRCSCRTGYSLSSNGYSCNDINECSSSNKCQHLCVNTYGSFRCSCRTGYTLSSNGYSCTDNNECGGSINCEHACVNTPGSYLCTCRTGYTLHSNGYSCQDSNECTTNNGGCSHTCVNEVGSFQCDCPSGYILGTDRRTCQDIDECSGSHSTCSQRCVNTLGSFTCACNTGYRLAGDGINCEDIDDCVNVTCEHGGHCLDGLASFTCSCQKGYTGQLCELDVDECVGVYNGGCEELCINTLGSFHCECTGNKTLQPGGLFCSGGSRKNVFERNEITQQRLPRGCSVIELKKCTTGLNQKLYLSSTSPWYRLESNSSVRYTAGIVFVELNDISVPFSLTGAELLKQSDAFSLTVSSLKYTAKDGMKYTDKLSTSNSLKDDCLTLNTTSRDIHDFLKSNSFLKSYFANLLNKLPDWLSFSPAGNSLLQVSDLKTELMSGSDVANDPWCSGAPVVPTHLYSILKYDGSLSVSVYGDRVQLPSPLAGEKYCFIFDVCQATLFLMLPKESRDLLEKFEVFKHMKSLYNIEIRPRGIGLSLGRHVNVHSQTREVQLWNGDRLFNYPVFPEANVWIGGDARMLYDYFGINGQTDMFFQMPSIEKLLTSVFLDEWNMLMRTKVTAGMIIKFELFGAMQEIRLKDQGVASVDIYASIGGTQLRQWCGPKSNPPGMFMSMMVRLNPFRHIPILEDWVFDFSTRLYVFFMTNPGSSGIIPNNKTDILSDFNELTRMIDRFTNIVVTTVKNYKVLLTNQSLSTAKDLQRSLDKTSDQLKSVQTTAITNGGLNTDLKSIGDSFDNIWKNGWMSIKRDLTRLRKSIEFNTRIAKYNLTKLFLSELDMIEQSLKATSSKLQKELLSILSDYKGVGFRFTAAIYIFHLKLGKFELEAVHSVDQLGACSKFKDAFKIFENKKSFRFIGILTAEYVKLGFFLHLDAGIGLGMALSIDTDKIMVQVHAQASILGIKTSADVLINNEGIRFYAEGKIWNSFKAKLTASAVHKNSWNELTFRVHGELLGNADKDENFDDSYIDALRKLLTDMGDSATHRITQAQRALKRAESGLTAAQNWLESKKSVVRSANSAFDSAVRKMDRAKDALERAKGPFKYAIAKLHQAQRKVDRLCRIKTCRVVCVPGLRCKTGWFGWLPYPRCSTTSCMFSIPDPFCVARNIGCRAIRAIAYGALEIAKWLVKVPMLALDAAKVAVSVAQVVVDKSRVVLDIAIAAIDLAKVGLEGAKYTFRGASLVLEGVKKVVQIGVKVVNFILKYGVQSLIDVKNCNFDIVISTKNLPVFAVGCDINPFRLGWIPIRFTVNFNRPIQSLWESAKVTVKAITDIIKRSIFGRKKRELLPEALFKTHKIIRSYEDVDIDVDSYLNETIDIVFETAGFENATFDEDYENRVAIFRRRCKQFQQIVSFLDDANNVLLNITNDTYTTLKAASDMYDQLETFDIDKIRSNFSLNNSGINPTVAFREFNISQAQLEIALKNANETLKNDSLLSEIQNVSQISKIYIKESSKTVESIRMLDQWIAAMDNVTSEYYTSDVCVSFLDCAHYSIAELLGLYYAEEFDNISDILNLISSLEDTFLELISNSSHPIQTIYNLSDTIRVQLESLKVLNPYCSIPPTMSPLSNRTVTVGGTVQFHCDVSGNPEPTIWWFRDDVYLLVEHQKVLTIENVTETNVTHRFRCIAGNVVANLSSDDAYLTVDDEPPYVVDEAMTDPQTDLRPILIPVFVLVALLTFVVGLIVWQCHKRSRARLDKARGSYTSLNMAILLSANPLNTGDHTDSAAAKTEQTI